MEKRPPYEVEDSTENAGIMLGSGYDHPLAQQGFISPQYTQSPNDFYDYYLRRIDTLAELKVVDTIIRHTFGYHRQKVRMGMQEIANYCGMTYNSVISGAEAAEKRGLIRRLNPGTKEKAVWGLVLSEPSKFAGSENEGINLQTLQVEPSKFKDGSRVKESIKKRKISSLDKARIHQSFDLFVSKFDKFITDEEMNRWLLFLEQYSEAKVLEIMDWAIKKEIHMTNRAALMDSLETAAANWSGRKPRGRKINKIAITQKSLMEALDGNS